MKNTNYLVNGEIFNINRVIPKNEKLKTLSHIYLIPVVSAGLAFCIGLFPIMVTLDAARYTRANYLYYNRKFKKIKHYNEINNILNIPKNTFEYAINHAINFKIISIEDKHITPKQMFIDLSNLLELNDFKNQIN